MAMHESTSNPLCFCFFGNYLSFSPLHHTVHLWCALCRSRRSPVPTTPGSGPAKVAKPLPYTVTVLGLVATDLLIFWHSAQWFVPKSPPTGTHASRVLRTILGVPLEPLIYRISNT